MRANKGQRRPTKGKTQVNKGPQRPMTANNSQRRPTQVNEGPQRPTKANAGQRRPIRFGLTYVFFRVLFQTNYLIQVLFSRVQANAGRQRPTAANDGQRRPTKTKRGPNDASGVVWAIICFFSNVQSIRYFFITSRSTYSCFFSNKPRSEPEPSLGRPWALY